MNLFNKAQLGLHASAGRFKEDGCMDILIHNPVAAPQEHHKVQTGVLSH